jgi:hypothetical protein
MYEIHKIITYQNSNFTEEYIKDYRFAELVHLLMFLSTVVKPPSYSKLNLNLRRILFN